jgi:hypothetical protein
MLSNDRSIVNFVDLLQRTYQPSLTCIALVYTILDTTCVQEGS